MQLQPSLPQENSPRPRFSWPMRLFLALLVVDMVFHSLASISHYRSWFETYDFVRFPKGLPTFQEVEELDGIGAVADRFLETGDSLWAYWQPWPSAASREKIEDGADLAKYYVAWLASRLDFLDRLVGMNQNWTMFSPSVDNCREVARSILEYEDGSLAIVRLTSDPEDLTQFVRLFGYRAFSYEGDVHKDVDTRWGYCNLLAHRHRVSEGGQSLRKIYVYKIRYDCPKPGEDAMAVLGAQNGPPGWEKEGPLFVYDVATRASRRLDDQQRRTALKHLEGLRTRVHHP